MFFFEIAFVFMFCCIAGWINEVIFRSIKNKRLINPGFMHGCSLPIYGCGGVIMYLISNADLSWIENHALRMIILFGVAILIMTALELFTGLFFLKVYHVMLWDYSKQWGNYKGIICPLFSIIWGIFCAIFYYLIYPWLHQLAQYASNHLVFTFFIGVYLGIFLIDMVVSLDLMVKIKNYAKRIKENVHLISLKRQSQEFFNKYKKTKLFTGIFKINNMVKKYIFEKMSISKKDISNKNNKKDE